MRKAKLTYTSTINKNPGSWNNRLLIGTPVTGLVRIEWVIARYGQIIPTNWSHVDCMQWLAAYAPYQYLVADAQNLIVKAAVEGNYEWVLFIEHDNVLPPDAFIRLNEYIRKADVPVVSALYFTKSVPPEPMVYRGRGNSYFTDWKMGEKVWVDGIPMGVTLIHGSILKAMWQESAEYMVGGQRTRRVVHCPENIWIDPERNSGINTEIGTSDLTWCSRVMEEDFFVKAGWKKFQKKKYPFLIDTNIFVKHIDQNGTQYPLQIPKEFIK